MKKAVVLILFFCYLLMTTGVVAVSHYCMDKLASVSFYITTEKKCSKCGMEKDKDAHSCCNDEETLVKGNSDQNKITQVFFELAAPDALPVFTTDFLLTKLENGFYHFANAGHPPPLPGNDIYLQHNVFRI